MNQRPYILVVRGILIDENKVLMCNRSAKSQSFPSLWEFPGGKVDKGEDFDAALIREFREETGFTVSLEKILGAGELPNEDKRYAYIFVRVKKIRGNLEISTEHDCIEWFDKKGLLAASVPPHLIQIRDLVAEMLH